MLTDTTTERTAIDPPARFGGEWIVPGDDHYEELRWLNDQRYDRHPPVIARPAGSPTSRPWSSPPVPRVSG